MAEAITAQTVLVTGASGFVATHIIKQLQEEGKYAVRGTVRNLKNEDKIKELKGLVPNATYPLELVEAELTKEEGWKEAVQGCTYVCHVASPFPLASPKHEDELIVPAVNGTLNVLKACTEAGTVKRVVVTSSCVSIGLIDDSHVLTEEDWQAEEGSSAYTKSKIRAERAAWDYVKGLEDDKKFELAVINPSVIVGPPLTRSNTGSLDLLKAILTKTMSALVDVKFGYVDVRDVAAAHIVAMDMPEAAGYRHLLSERVTPLADVAELISREFTPQGYNIPSFKLPKPLAFMIKFVNSEIKDLYPQLGKDIKYNNERMLNVLKIQPHDTTKSIIESCYSLIESGAVEKTPGYLGPPESRKQPVEESKTEETTPQEPEKTEETPHEPEKTGEATQEPEDTVETPQEPETTEETPQEPENTEETPQEPEKTGETPQEPETTEETPQEPEKMEEAPQEPETTEETPQEPEKTGEAPQEPETTEETPQEPEKTEEAPQEPETTEETPQEPEEEKTEEKSEELVEESKTEETTDEQEQ